MYSQINKFSEERGLSQSGAARILIDRALAAKNDALNEKFEGLNRQLQSILHAASASRVFASEAAQAAGTTITNDEFKERIVNLIKRYNEFEG
jgi:hypothetical protein